MLRTMRSGLSLDGAIHRQHSAAQIQVLQRLETLVR